MHRFEFVASFFLLNIIQENMIPYEKDIASCIRLVVVQDMYGVLTILTWKNLIQYKNSLKYKAGCF